MPHVHRRMRNELTYRITFIASGLFCITIFFTPPYDKGIFLLSSIILLIGLLLWISMNRSETNPLPQWLTTGTLLFVLAVHVSALLSSDRKLALMYLLPTRFIIMGLLLYLAPIKPHQRRWITTILLLAGALSGIVGIAQYFGFLSLAGNRAYGFAEHPTTYALTLTVICSSAVLMLFMPETSLYKSRLGSLFLVFVAFLSFYGVLLSQTRGAWVALFMAPAIILFLYHRRKTLYFILVFIVAFAAASSFTAAIKNTSDSDFLRRLASIFTSIYSEDITGSTGNRFELWKGALILFERHPISGNGLGDYPTNIKQLIDEGSISKHTSAYLHAHNVYFEALAAGGIVGITILLAFLTCIIRFAQKRIHCREAGGYFILQMTLIFVITGLTYSPQGDAKYLAVLCLTGGLLGSQTAVTTPGRIN